MEEATSFTLDMKQKEKLERIAFNEHRSLAGQLRLIVSEWLESHEEEK